MTTNDRCYLLNMLNTLNRNLHIDTTKAEHIVEREYKKSRAYKEFMEKFESKHEVLKALDEWIDNANTKQPEYTKDECFILSEAEE